MSLATLIPWVNDTDLTDDPSLRNANLPTGVTLADICDASTDYLWRASGGIYDAHEVTIRPSRLVDYCGCGLNNPSAGLALAGGTPLFGGFAGCSCYGPSEIDLGGPATDIAVTVEGVLLADTEWVLLDGHRLVRVGVRWPCCQRATDRPGGPGTWSITFTEGLAPPALGRLAARELGLELANYFSGRESKLPRGTASITRAGISIQMTQPKRRTDGQTGSTGLPTVELFLDAVNPSRQRRRPQVISPDTLVGGRIT